MMDLRNNNIFWKTYHEELNKKNITPFDEVEDCLALIKDEKADFYNDLRSNLEAVKLMMENGEPLVVKTTGRRPKTYKTPADYISTFICDPAEKMNEIMTQRPWIKTPAGEGMYHVRYDVTTEEARECRMLHWLYVELETIFERLGGWNYDA